MTSPSTAPPIEPNSADGPIEGRCRARRGDGKWCTKYPVKGAKVCGTHGGRAPQVKAAAKKRIEQREAAAAVATYGLPREVAPDIALLEEVHRTAGHVEWLHQLVQLADTTALTQRSEQGTVTASVWMDLYQRERKHLTEVCRAALAAGIAERQVRLAEQQGALLAGAVNRILDQLDLTVEQRRRVPEVVPLVLRQIEGAA